MRLNDFARRAADDRLDLVRVGLEVLVAAADRVRRVDRDLALEAGHLAERVRDLGAGNRDEQHLGRRRVSPVPAELLHLVAGLAPQAREPAADVPSPDHGDPHGIPFRSLWLVSIRIVLELVGSTPIVRLDRLSPPGGARILAKLEYLNPGGSVKDRIGLAMIEAGRARGEAQAGRDDRRADLRQHRRRPRHRGGRQGLPLHLRHARQDEPGEDLDAARVRRRGRDHADRGRPRLAGVLLLRLVAARRGDPRRLQARPVLEHGEPAGALRRHRRPRSGSRPAASSTRS